MNFSCILCDNIQVIFFVEHAYLAPCTWRFASATPLQDMLGPDQGYDGMYGQGPPSVHSSHGGRIYHQQGMHIHGSMVIM